MRLLGVILEETSPEELQKQATVKPSVLKVLLEITKCCDLYLMERVLDDESESDSHSRSGRIWKNGLDGVHGAKLWFGIRNRYGKALPRVDVFVCTADPASKPPLMVVNTVLSAMAYD
nr:peroxisome biogenesis protein 22-like [Ipomoea batatas]